MKNLFYIMLFLSITLFSCNKDKDDNTIGFSYTLGTKNPNSSFTQKGGSQNELLITADNKLLIYYDSYDTTKQRYMTCLRKIDIEGNLIWEKNYECETYSHANAVNQTLDGGYLLTGTINYEDSWVSTYAFVIKTDQNGETQWGYNYLDGYLDSGIKTKPLSNDSYLLFTYTDLSKNRIFIINSNGDTLSSKYMEREKCEPSCSGYYDFQNDNNGNYFFTGEYLAKYDADLNSKWAKEMDFVGKSIVIDESNNCIVFGNTEKYGKSDYCLSKFDNSGNLIWHKTYDIEVTDYAAHIEKTDDGGFILLGTSEDNTSDIGVIKLIKVDKDGKLIKQKDCNYDPDYSNSAYSVKQVASNQYIIFGLSNQIPFLSRVTL